MRVSFFTLFFTSVTIVSLGAVQPLRAQDRGNQRLEPEQPLVQQIAIDYYTAKYHVSAAEARRRIELQDQSAGIEDDLTNLLGDQFAGIWYDHSDRGRLKIGMTRIAMRQAAAVRSLVDRYGVSAATDLSPVQFTLAELERKQDDVRGRIIDLVTAGHAVTSYDTKLNRVVVTAITRLATAEQSRVRSLSTEAEVVVHRVAVDSLLGTPMCNIQSCGPPLRGGRALDLCTAAFMARDRASGSLLAVTAGHCTMAKGDFSATWQAMDELSSWHLIGRTFSWTFAGAPGMDAGTILINPSQFWATPTPLAALVVEPSTLTAFDPNYTIHHDAFSSMGQLLCRSGKTTHTHCAEVSGLGVDFPGDFGNGQIFVVKNMGELDMCMGQPGDSGAPVYKNSRAFGILIGGGKQKPLHCFEVYQGIRGAEKALSFDVLLAP